MGHLHIKLVLLKNLLESLQEDFLTLCRSDKATIWNKSDRQPCFSPNFWKQSVLKIQEDVQTANSELQLKHSG